MGCLQSKSAASNEIKFKQTRPIQKRQWIVTTPEWQMNEFDIYTVHKIGELFGIQESEKSHNDHPSKNDLQTYLSKFFEECFESGKVDFFLFVYCGTHSTARKNQHALLLSRDDG